MVMESSRFAGAFAAINRDTYMEEYRLTPDELIAKAFRIIQSSRRGYYPNGKSEWIAAVKKVYKRDGKVFAGHFGRRTYELARNTAASRISG
jgi:hypothetical protein